MFESKYCSYHAVNRKEAFLAASTTDCPFCEINRLTAQLVERDDVLSARFNENKELYMHWQQALTENTTLRTQLAECEKEVERLKEVQGICEICEVEAIKHADKSRKQAAMECLERIKYQSYYQLEEWLKKHFGLEG